MLLNLYRNGKEGNIMSILSVFLVTVAANVTAHYIIKWLDKR